jgi:lipopolysaccharide transport system permease protein
MFLINYFREVYKFKDFLYYLSFSYFKSQFSQTELGFLWGVINPFATSFAFTILGLIYNVSDDLITHFVFTLTGMLPWVLFREGLLNTSECYLKNANLIKQVKFPRIILLLANLTPKFVDFLVGFMILIIILLVKNAHFGISFLLIPLLLLINMFSSIGIGLLLIKPITNFRDLRFLLRHAIPLVMFISPVVYSSTAINGNWLEIYSYNPLVSVIEGFRAIFNNTAIPWILIFKGSIVSSVIFILGLFVFVKNENSLSDYL